MKRLQEAVEAGNKQLDTAEKDEAITGGIDDIMAYEDGGLDAEQTLELFSILVKNKMAWSLQGAYGRMAAGLIKAGYLDNDGTILKHPSAED